MGLFLVERRACSSRHFSVVSIDHGALFPRTHTLSLCKLSLASHSHERLNPRLTPRMKTITSYFNPKGSSNKNKRALEEKESSEKDPTPLKKLSITPPSDDTAVKDLISPLQQAPDWESALSKHFASVSFRSLAQFVAKERRSKTIYPQPQDTFATLLTTPLQQVKVVIVGQDPYHGPGQAHGLSFSVQKGQRIPPSLLNIYKELANDVDHFTPQRPTHGYLMRWAQQGVLLLNTVLTVQAHQANSHQKKGWEAVTDEILRAVVRQKTGVVFLLWGKPAAAKIGNAIVVNPKYHKVISTSHPSPLGATKTKQPFIGSKCFSRCNDALVEMGREPIDWNVDGPLPTTSHHDA